LLEAYISFQSDLVLTMYWKLCIGKYHLSGFLSCRKMKRIPSTHCLWCNKKEWHQNPGPACIYQRRWRVFLEITHVREKSCIITLPFSTCNDERKWILHYFYCIYIIFHYI